MLFLSAAGLAVAFAATTNQMSFTDARAMVDRIEIAAQECDWALKVTKKITDCDTFFELTSGDHRKYEDVFPALIGHAEKADKENNIRAKVLSSQITRKIEEIDSVLALLNIFIREGKYVAPDAR